VLRIMAKTFECYIMESAEAERIADELTALEAALQSHRNTMALGCVCHRTQKGLVSPT
jgi:hypothetical protein